MSQKIDYLRTKISFRDKIILDSETNSFKNQHTTVTKGWDHILNRWDIISETKQLQDVSKYPTNPEKTKSFYAIIQRNAIDYATLKPLTKYFKRKITVSIKNSDSNLFLVMVQGKLFMTNVLSQDFSMTAPICLNTIMMPKNRPDTIKVDISKEAEAINNLERDQLLKQGFPCYEEIVTPEGSQAEFRTLI